MLTVRDTERFIKDLPEKVKALRVNKVEDKGDIAGLCVELYRLLVGDDDTEQALGDLLGDLRHFATAKGFSYVALDSKGEEYFREEVALNNKA